MEKLPHYYCSWIVSFQKQRYMRAASSGNKNIRRQTTDPFGSPGGGEGRGRFLGEISSSRHYTKKDYKEKKKEDHRYKI
jgi:hypothetical protein